MLKVKEVKTRAKLNKEHIFQFFFYPFAPEDLMSRNKGLAVPSRVSPTEIRNRDKILARSNQPEHQLCPLHDDDLGVRTTASTVWNAASVPESELQPTLMCCSFFQVIIGKCLRKFQYHRYYG